MTVTEDPRAVLSMELIGMAVGSIVLGSVCDRIGRKPMVLLCLVIMACGMFLASTAGSVTILSTYRLITGLGIGGMLAATNAVVAEFSNTKNKALAVALMAAGYPAGAIIGGSVSSWLLATTGSWRGIFVFGAICTAAMIPVVLLLLPESVGFLVHKRPQNVVERVNATMKRIGQPTISALPDHLHEAPKTKVTQLFSGGLGMVTVLLTLAYFFHIMTFYFTLKWVPKIVVDMGFEPASAGGVLVWANVGGLLGSILLSFLSLKIQTRTLVIAAMILSTLAIIVFGRGQADLGQMSLIVALAGFCTNAAVVGIYAIIAMSYPDSLVVHLEEEGGNGDLILFVVPEAGRDLDDDLRAQIVSALRAGLSPRHVPDEIRQMPVVPRNLTGKKLELPVKRILQGADLDTVASRDSLAQPDCLDPYVALAATRGRTGSA